MKALSFIILVSSVLMLGYYALQAHHTRELIKIFSERLDILLEQRP